MKDIVYYPTIDVQDKKWLAHILLYADNIYTIAPDLVFDNSFLHREDDLYLLQNEGFLHGIRTTDIYNNFNSLYFIEYVQEEYKDQWGYFEKDISKADEPFIIHNQKLLNDTHLINFLEEHNLIKKEMHDGWQLIHPDIGRDYMFFIAKEYSDLHNYTPMTDIKRNQIRQLNNISEEEIITHNIREAILPTVIPTFHTVPDFKEIIKFKNKNENLLDNFRKELEKEITSYAKLSHPEKLDFTIDKMSKDLTEISNELNEGLKINFKGLISKVLIKLLQDGYSDSNPLMTLLPSAAINGYTEMNRIRKLHKNSAAYLYYLNKLKKKKLPEYIDW
ncbi:hypothetical protein [Salinicoccus roseus]|uniref:hypothetical protein n=1 Tax=Salinicoccus roseus TaxID=45670 RepID=UPI00230061C9|nr:hypothetical protein [Salinicoccus roseus]